jgi:hypothetical protein
MSGRFLSAAATRIAGRALLLVLVLAVSGGGCVFAFSSGGGGDDDCPEGEECKDPLSVGRASPPSASADAQAEPFVAPDLPLAAYRLTRFVPAFPDEAHSHPVRRLVHIEGLSPTELWGRGDWGAEALLAFAEAVREANDIWLGLPRAAGFLTARGVTVTGRHVLVDYEQRPDGVGPGAPALPDTRLLFVFDLGGRLIWIENDTLVPAWSVPADGLWQGAGRGSVPTFGAPGG